MRNTKWFHHQLKHYRQAFDSWTRLVPDRSRYAILCSFDKLHIYDFETQIDSPGMLIITGDSSNTGEIIVEDGATLGGTRTLSRVTVSGTLFPGRYSW